MTELLPQTVRLAPTEQALGEARQALVRLLDHDLAIIRLGAELGIDPMEVARRSARVALTSLREDDKPVTLVIAESEDQLHEVVETVRSPGVYRYKTIQRAAPVPALPSETAAPEANAEAPAESALESSKQEEKAEA